MVIVGSIGAAGVGIVSGSGLAQADSLSLRADYLQVGRRCRAVC
jgi:hypothetical protein